MPFYDRGNVRIHYEEVGSGFPLMIIPGGGLNSTVAGLATHPFNPLEEFKDEFRVIAADLRKPEAQALVRRLVAQFDVVIENFRPGALEKWGLGYAELAKSNPGLVMVRISGYGQSGPYSARPGYGIVCEAVGGLRYIIGDPDRPPARANIGLTDYITGLYAAFGAMMARARQAREGGSWHVQVSLARTGHWLWNLGRLENGLVAADIGREAVLPLLEESPSGFGKLSAVRHSAMLSATPATWARPAVPLGTHSPQWP